MTPPALRSGAFAAKVVRDLCRRLWGLITKSFTLPPDRRLSGNISYLCTAFRFVPGANSNQAGMGKRAGF